MYALLARVWGVCTGPLTAILIATKFTQELQGYYYTFGTILAMQVFVELGLGVVIQQFASHEWSKLSLDQSGRIVGDRDALSRLISIAEVATKWYIAGGLIVAFGLGIGGYVFFHDASGSGVSWQWQWLLLCFFTGINICLVPIWALLEGCNQVSSLYLYRLIQVGLSSLAVWTSIFLGAGLWTPNISLGVVLVCALVFLRTRYWPFLKTLILSNPAGPRVSWSRDLLPMQWRIAVTWASSYFIYSLFTPVLFKYQGPIVAGQFGMTWSAVGVIGIISTSWLSPRVPQFAMLIAQKKYEDLHILFWRTTKIVIAVSILIGFMVWFLVFALNAIDYSFAKRLAVRLLPPLPTGLFVLAQTLMIASGPFSTYMRAHKKEPIMFITVLAALMVGTSTFITGKYYSVNEMALGYLLVHIIVIPILILIWHHSRIRWIGKNNDE